MERLDSKAVAMAVALAMMLWAFGWLQFARPAGPAENYTATFWAWEDARNHAIHSHTWATFERYTGGKLVERLCISWGPATPRVGVVVATRGRNASLEESLATAKRQGLAVYASGPYPCHPELFWRAKARIRQLESGMLYVVLDHGHDRCAVNCIGAVCGIFPNPPRTGVLHGRAATEVVARHFRNYLR